MTKLFLAEKIPPMLLETMTAKMPDTISLTEDLKSASAVLVENFDLPSDFFKGDGQNIKDVIYLDTGSAKIDAPESVTVHSISNPGLIGVCDHVVMFIINLSSQFLWVNRKTINQEWVEGSDTPQLTDAKNYAYNWVGLPKSGCLYNKRVGIIGMGHIGRGIAARLKPFGMQILYHDLNRLDKELEKKLGLVYLSRKELLEQSDFVSVNTRLIIGGKDSNEKSIGAEDFKAMKKSAYFINTSRGRMIDEEALIEALKNKEIAGAGLDVFTYEPLQKESPLFELAGDNVILTPHLAGTFMPEAWDTVASAIFDRLTNC